MDNRFVINNQIIDRYLMNKLSEDELAEFEQYFLQEPEVVKEIELRKRFIQGLRKLDRNEILFPKNSNSSIEWRWASRFRPFVSAVATASACLLLITTGLLLVKTSGLQEVVDRQARNIDQMLAPQANTLLVPLGRVRGTSVGADPVVRIQLSSDVEHVILALDMKSQFYDRYRLILSQKGVGQVWSQESDNIPPAVVLPVKLISPGEYDLSILGMEAGGDLIRTAQFAFTLLER